jgi:hypothetical protein
MSYVAIIPSLGALGPLGLLALVAPAVFAGLMLWMRRWSAALGAASAMTTVFLFQAWWQAPLRPMWWSTRAGLWAVLAGLAGTFYVWALNRTRPVSASEANAQRADKIALTFALIVSGVWTTFMIAASRWSESLGLAAIVVFISVVMAMIALHHRHCAETVLLTALALGCVSVSGWESIRAIFSSELRVEWVFEADRSGAFLNSPAVTGARIYLGAAHHDGLHQDGEVYAIDRLTGRRLWSSRADGDLRPMYGTPIYANGRLYFGEGLHANRGCRLWSFDMSRGEPSKNWMFATSGISTPDLNRGPFAMKSAPMFGVAGSQPCEARL